jgi:putative selenium metabolism hydrolase
MNKEIVSKIISLSEKYRDYTLANLSRLVRIRSLSCQEESLMLELRRMMQEAGIQDPHTDGLGNLIGKIGNGRKIIAFDGHMDTVDTGQESNWDFAPFSGKVENGFLQGRGSVDQKGGLACMVTAARILNEVGVPENLTIYFIATVMEEDCDGLCWKYIIEEDHIKPDAVVITEPTNLTISRGQRGRMEILVEFSGISSHGSAPERGKNAIYMAAEASLKIRDLNYQLAHHDFLGKGSIAVTEIKSDSPALCAVADYASIYIDRRLTIGESKESAMNELQAAIDDLKASISIPFYEGISYTGNRYGMEKHYPTWVMPEDHEIIQDGIVVSTSLFGKRPSVGKWLFSTNAVSIQGIHGIPVIGFGPGEEVMAHAPNEKIPVKHLVDASAFYAAYALKFSEK